MARDKLAVALERLRLLSKASWLTKEEKDALKYAVVIVEEVERMFDYSGEGRH